MELSLLALVFDCRDARAQAGFWATVMGRRVTERNAGEFEVGDPSGRHTPLNFMNVEEPKAVKNRLHIDVTTTGDLRAAVQRLVAEGASLVELRQDPSTLANPDTWAVMLDPEGNEFCVLNADTVTGMS